MTPITHVFSALLACSDMQRAAFYIVERAPAGASAAAAECKEPEGLDLDADSWDGMGPLERWDFCEDLPLEFCAAQSVLHRVYGG